MAFDTVLLRKSLELALARNPNLVGAFYETLFREHPSVRPLFQRSFRNVQEKMLEQSLFSIVDHLEDPLWLGRTLRVLGARHESYGVTSEMYGWFGDALLRTLAGAMGKNWTDAIEQGFAEAYGMVMVLMRGGAMLAANERARATSP